MNFIKEEYRIYAVDHQQQLLAEIDFPKDGDNLVCITHTYVAPQLRGQKIGEKLVTLALDEIRQKGWNYEVSCSYASAILKRNEIGEKEI